MAMSERQLPWHAKRDNITRQFIVEDDEGHRVAECYGGDDNDGREEAVAICEAINRQGDRICHNCGEPAYACDECCGHGNEDGHCEPVSPESTQEGT